MKAKPETTMDVCRLYSLSPDTLAAALVASGTVDLDTLTAVAEWASSQLLAGSPSRDLIYDQLRYES